MSETIQHTDVQKDAPAEIKDNKAESDFKKSPIYINCVTISLQNSMLEFLPSVMMLVLKSLQ